MAVRIAIANVRGGVGKSTTTMMLAEGLALRGSRVLVIDIDPQAMVSELLLRFDGLNEVVRGGRTLADLLGRIAAGKAPKLANCRTTSTELTELGAAGARGCVDVVASNTSLLKDLVNIEQQIRSRHKSARLDAVIAHVLGPELARLDGSYDVIIFDCQAGTLPLNLAALRLSQHVLAPTNLEDNSFAKLMDFIRIILDDDLDLAGRLTVHVLFTMYAAEDAQQRRFLKFIKQGMKTLNYLPRPIPQSTAIQRAASDVGDGKRRNAKEKYAAALAEVEALAAEMTSRIMGTGRR